MHPQKHVVLFGQREALRAADRDLVKIRVDKVDDRPTSKNTKQITFLLLLPEKAPTPVGTVKACFSSPKEEPPLPSPIQGRTPQPFIGGPLETSPVGDSKQLQ